MARPKKSKDDTIIVKKYANRRLYDTGRSSYVTLDDLSEMIREGQDFIVVDAKTNEDLTQSVLTQIIVEQEAKGDKMLPPAFLRQLIQFYGDNLQSFVPDYLEQSMQNLVQNQEQLRDTINQSIEQTMKPMSTPMEMVEHMSRTNMEIMNNTMKAFSPFQMFTGMQQNANPQAAASGAQKAQQGQNTMSAQEYAQKLEEQIAMMSKELENLKKKSA